MNLDEARKAINDAMSKDPCAVLETIMDMISNNRPDLGLIYRRLDALDRHQHAQDGALMVPIHGQDYPQMQQLGLGKQQVPIQRLASSLSIERAAQQVRLA